MYLCIYIYIHIYIYIYIERERDVYKYRAARPARLGLEMCVPGVWNPGMWEQAFQKCTSTGIGRQGSVET